MLDKNGIAKRIAKEVKNGYYVNLGIGIPTLVANFVRDDIEVEFILNDEFIEYVNDASKSRDGFASFYEGIEQVSKEPSIFLEYLFQWFVLSKYRDEVIDKTYENLNEIIYENLYN